MTTEPLPSLLPEAWRIRLRRGRPLPSPALLPGRPGWAAGCDPPHRAGSVGPGRPEPAGPFQAASHTPGTQSPCLTARHPLPGCGQLVPCPYHVAGVLREAQGGLGGAHTCAGPHRARCRWGGVGRGQPGEGSRIWTLSPWPVAGLSPSQGLREVVWAIFIAQRQAPAAGALLIPGATAALKAVSPNSTSFSNTSYGLATTCMTPASTVCPKHRRPVQKLMWAEGLPVLSWALAQGQKL